MVNPRTFFHLHLTLSSKVTAETIAFLKCLLDNRNDQVPIPKDLAIPNAAFFTVPNWKALFAACACEWIVNVNEQTYTLIATGDTALEEQDIGLFLRWLCPDLQDRPRYFSTKLAVVNNYARQDSNALVYTVRRGRLHVYYTDKPMTEIKEFSQLLFR